MPKNLPTGVKKSLQRDETKEEGKTGMLPITSPTTNSVMSDATPNTDH